MTAPTTIARRRITRLIWTGVALAVFALTSCGQGDIGSTALDSATSTATTTTTSSPPPPTPTQTTTEPTTTTSAPTSTTAPTTTTTEPPATPSTTTPETSGTWAAQERLVELGYWLDAIDGVAGSNTAHAITAFQKVEGLTRSGRLDEATLTRLAEASRPTPRSSVGRVLEIDLARQVLLVATDGRATWVFDISTGTSATPTPTGTFQITHEIDGYRYAPLGTLYRPKYFNGGIAFHGYTSVPVSPASHGCVRLTYPAMDAVWAMALAPLGTTVEVY